MSLARRVAFPTWLSTMPDTMQNEKGEMLFSRNGVLGVWAVEMRTLVSGVVTGSGVGGGGRSS